MNSDAFLILFIAFMAVMGLIPFILRRYQIPSVIALLLAGMLLGPNCFDMTGRLSELLGYLGANSTVTAQHFDSLVNSLGSLGLVFLMALAGMEADFKLIHSARNPVISLSILTFLLPAISGYLVYACFRADDFPGKLLYASLFASHSVGIVFPVIRELKLTKTKFGAAVLISTIITDISSIILLAVSVQLKRLTVSGATGPKTLSVFDYIDPNILGQWFTPVFLVIVIFYMVAAIYVVSQLGKWLLKVFQPGEDMLITILLFLILATVLAGEFLGINLVVGAFIAGLALSKLVKPQGGGFALMGRFESIGYGFLVPFLFVSIGMKTDFSAFGASGNLMIVLFTVIGLVGSKVFSGWFALRITGFSNGHGLCAGLMTVPQLSATLAAAAIGKDLGMLDDNFFNAIVILSIVTTLPIPSLVRMLISKMNLQFSTVEDEAYQIPEAEKDDELI